MPIAMDPLATTDICLDIDKDKPDAVRPVFVSRFLTKRQADEIDRLTAAADAEPDNAKCFGLLMQALRIGIVGWRNFSDPLTNEPLTKFDEDGVRAALSDTEIWEIAVNYPRRVGRGELERKKSLSQSAAVGDRSAPVATPEKTAV